MEWTWAEVFNAYDACWEESGRQAQELFGDKNTLPEDELEIVFNDRLYPTHEDKLATLGVIRSGKEVKPKSFARRITKAGRIHAKGLGIRLD